MSGMGLQLGFTTDPKIIHGDNLEALKALLPEYEGRVDCIYIDPPYNTGNEGWVYNDNVNDPHIRKWLGEVVGAEGEDLSRHDKWACMIVPRLRLIEQLMSQTGALVISISYHELHTLLCICREMFPSKQVVPITIQTSGGKPSGGFNFLHEYLVFVVSKDFEPNLLSFCGGNPRKPFEGLTLSTFNKTNRPNQVYPIFVDPVSETLVGVGKSLHELIELGQYVGEKEDFIYDYSVAPEGTVAIWPITSKGKECVWRQIPSRVKNDWEKGYVKIIRNKVENHPNSFSVQYLPEGLIRKLNNGLLEVVGHEAGKPTLLLGENETEGSSVPTIWIEKDFYTVKGTNILKDILGENNERFDYPKSQEMMTAVLQAISKDDDIILDAFAGSGTTAHAVLDLNKKDGGNRKFILIEMMDYAENITAERIRRVINGYGTKPETQNGTGGGFSFYTVGEPLFQDDNLNPKAPLCAIREYIGYTEGLKDIWHTDNGVSPHALGYQNGTAYVFYYEPHTTALSWDFLNTLNAEGLSEKPEQWVIYADTNVLTDEQLKQSNIIFKRIPRDISGL